ncbi:hypothetical protein LMH73_009320 [Vibrio splendidus]|nr:hypothetical protein [Vibrio splendidus]MCC4881857.1 hypothetical protein [Vibrio splendidus]
MNSLKLLSKFIEYNLGISRHYDCDFDSDFRQMSRHSINYYNVRYMGIGFKTALESLNSDTISKGHVFMFPDNEIVQWALVEPKKNKAIREMLCSMMLVSINGVLHSIVEWSPLFAEGTAENVARHIHAQDSELGEHGLNMLHIFSRDMTHLLPHLKKDWELEDNLDPSKTKQEQVQFFINGFSGLWFESLVIASRALNNSSHHSLDKVINIKSALQKFIDSIDDPDFFYALASIDVDYKKKTSRVEMDSVFAQYDECLKDRICPQALALIELINLIR